MSTQGRVGVASSNGGTTPRRGLWTPGVAELERELAKRQAARERLIPFCEYIWPDFQVRPHRQLIAAALELVESRKITRLLVFSPSQVGKSTLVSQFFPPWYLGKHPNHNIILCSYGSDLAAQHSYMARQNMMEERYKAIFGDLSPYDDPVEISDKAAATKHWRLKPPYRGSLKSAGVGSGISGFGSHLLIIDDPLKDSEEADSEKIRNTQVEWFNTTAMPRLSQSTVNKEDEGVVVICQTRWHDLDLSGVQLRAQADGGEQWHVLRLTAVAESEQEIGDWCARNGVDREHYLVLAPAKEAA